MAEITSMKLTVGQTQNFRVQGFDANNNPVDFPPGTTIALSTDQPNIAKVAPTNMQDSAATGVAVGQTQLRAAVSAPGAGNFTVGITTTVTAAVAITRIGIVTP